MPTLQYIAKEDSLEIDAKGKDEVFINQLLKTKIPKYEFPEEYLSFLDSREDKMQNLFINELKENHEKLKIEEQGKNLCLKRK